MSEVYIEQLEVMHPLSPELGALAMKVVTGLTVDGEHMESLRLVGEYEPRAIGESRQRLFLPSYQSQNLKTLYKNVFCDVAQDESDGPAGPESYDCHAALHTIMGWDKIATGTKTAPVGTQAQPVNNLESQRPYRIGARGEGRITVLHSVLAIGSGTLSVLGVDGPLVVAEPEALLHAYQGTGYFRALPPKPVPSEPTK